MKLKTLKDMVDYFKSNNGGCLFVSSDELRQEAMDFSNLTDEEINNHGKI